MYVYFDSSWIDSSPATANTYNLPTATSSVLGGVKVGNNLSIDPVTGVLSAENSYSLPTASDLVLGGVKVGNNLSIDPVTGVLSAGNSYNLPTATSSVLGGVKVDASSITIDAGGIISVPAVASIGISNGIAQLGSDGKLAASQIPTSLSGAIVFKGTWDAATNTPTLADGVGTNGWEYTVSVGGTQNLGSGNITFVAGDYIIYNGTIWQRIPSTTIAEAGTLTGTTLNATVVNSSLTTVGTLTHLTVTNDINGSVTGNAGTVTNGVVTTGTYADPIWITSLAASKVGLGNVTNESKATMFASPTFTGTVTGVTATHVGLDNVTNESKATMFASPTFTGTVTGVTATHVGLGNVTNESKATMFSSPAFTGIVTGVTATRINPRTSSGATYLTLTPNIADFDQYNITDQNGTLTVAAPTGTPVDGNKLMFRIFTTTAGSAITWNATYTVIGTALPTVTVTNKTIYIGCIYNAANTRWDVIAVATQL